MNDGLKDKYRAAIVGILAANDRIERAVLFGSRAMETHTPTSDVDIALFGDLLTLTDQADIASAVEELPIPQRVDLLLYKMIDDRALLAHIEKHGVEWYRREPRESMTHRKSSAGSARMGGRKRSESSDAALINMGLDRPIDITTDQRKTLLALIKRHLPNTTAWVYGSRVKWTSRPQSDLDLVVFTEPDQERRVSELREAFEESNLPFRVDLFVWDAVPEQFRKQIEAEHVVLMEKKEQDAVGEWRVTTLDQLGCIVTGKTPHSRHPEYFGGEIPFVTPTDFDGRRRIESTGRCLTEQGAIAVHGARIPSEAIMVSCIGSDMGKAAIATNACVTNQQINSIIVESDDSPLFVYYNLSTRKEEIRVAAGGSAQPILNKSAFGQLYILLPPLPEQRAIAHVLGTLDDKIELNRRMNETLEAMARALFKSWFIDFDPVRAKMAGRDPGLPQRLADLFPDRLVDSELGEIPEGWEVTTLGSLVDVMKGCSYTSKDLINSKTALVTLKSFARGGGYRPDGLKSFAGPYKNGQVVSPGEVIIAATDVTQAAEVIGRPALVGYDPSFQTLVASLDVLIIRPTTNAMYSQAFLYFLTGTSGFSEHMYAHTTGTTVLHLSKGAVPTFKFALPPQQLVECFDHFADPFIKQIQLGTSELEALSSMRDTLLPKLMSGELRVKQMEMETR